MPKKILILALVLQGWQVFAGGGWSGNGGGPNYEGNNTWFNSGQSEIPYCVSVHNFPLSPRQANEKVATALSAWRSFFQKYGMDKIPFGANKMNGKMTFKDGEERYLNFNFKSLGQCKKSFNPVKQNGIVFLFGASNHRIDKYKSMSPENELGLALRGPYDHQNYTSGGYVWIDSFSRDEKRLHHILLHEIGHVFGMRHDSVFVMDSEIANTLLNKNSKSDNLGQIESNAWKYKVTFNQEISLSSEANLGGFRLKKIPRYIFEACGGSHLPARLLAKKLRNKYKIDDSDCVSIILSGLEKAESKKFSLTMTLKMKKSGKKFIFFGKFKRGRKDRKTTLGPSIFTKYFYNRPEDSEPRLVYRSGSLEIFNFLVPARGHFIMAGKRFPATIELSKGFELDVFMPFAKDWWLIKNVHTGFRE